MDQTNFLLWQNLAWLILRSYRIEGYLIGEKGCPSKFISTDLSEKSAEKQLRNPEYETWMAVDQLYTPCLQKMEEYLTIMKK